MIGSKPGVRNNRKSARGLMTTFLPELRWSKIVLHERRVKAPKMRAGKLGFLYFIVSLWVRTLFSPFDVVEAREKVGVCHLRFTILKKLDIYFDENVYCKHGCVESTKCQSLSIFQPFLRAAFLQTNFKRLYKEKSFKLLHVSERKTFLCAVTLFCCVA